VIRSFRDRDAERLFKRQRIRRVPPDLQRIVLRKLVMLDAATSLLDSASRPQTVLKNSPGIGPVNTVSVSTISGASASAGSEPTRTT
jgi:hypothetical protein